MIIRLLQTTPPCNWRAGGLFGITTITLVFLFGNPSFGQDGQILLQQVAQLTEEGRTMEAEEALRTFLLESADPDVELRLALLLLEQAYGMSRDNDLGRHLANGLAHESLASFEDLVETDAENHAAQRGVALAQEFLMRPEMAIGTLQVHLDADQLVEERDSECLRTYLEILLRTGEIDTARAEFLNRSEGFGLDDRAHNSLQLAIAAAGNDRDRFEMTLHTLANLEEDPMTLCSAAWDFFQSDSDGSVDFESLIHLYSQLWSQHPAVGTYRFYRGATRYLAGDAEGATRDLEPCLETPDLVARTEYFLGRVALKKGQPAQARVLFDSVIEANEAYSQDALLGLVDVAVAFGRERDYQQSLETYDRILALEPQNEWALIGRPLCFKGMGLVDECIEAYEAALRERPGHPQLNNDLGLVLWGIGRQDEARARFAEAVAAGSSDSMENLGVIAWNLEKSPALAAEYFGRVLRIEPDRPKSRFYRELASEAARHP